MVLYMIIGLGQTLSNTWVQEASQIALSTAGLQSLFGLLASVIVFMALAWQVPKLASSILQGSLQMGSSDLIAPAMSAAVVAGTIGAVATAGVGAVAGGVGLLGAGGAAAAGGGAGAAGGASGAGGSFMPGAAGGMMPGMGSTMAGGGGSGAAPGVEGAMNSVPPPAPSAGGGGGDVVAVDPPPISVAADSSPTPGQSAEGSSAGMSVGESGATGSSATVPTQGKTPRVADAGEAIVAGGESVSGPAGNVSVSDSGATSASVPASGEGGSAATGEAAHSGESPAGSPGVVIEAPLGSVSPAGEEASGTRSRSDGRSLGEKISGIHNAAAQAHQHLPQDSATVSAPTLNIQHGE
jgi:hypothetical protein